MTRKRESVLGQEYQQLTEERDKLQTRKFLFVWGALFFFLVTLFTLYCGEEIPSFISGMAGAGCIAWWAVDKKRIEAKLAPIEKRILQIEVDALRYRNRQ